jgi:hypothetical protein
MRAIRPGNLWPLFAAAITCAGCGSEIIKGPDPSAVGRISVNEARATLRRWWPGLQTPSSAGAFFIRRTLTNLRFTTAEAFEIDREPGGTSTIRYQDLLEPAVRITSDGLDTNYWIDLTPGGKGMEELHIHPEGPVRGEPPDRISDRIAEALAVLKHADPPTRVEGWAAESAPTAAISHRNLRDPNAPALNIAVADLSADGLSQSDASVIANILRGELINTGAYNVVEKKDQDKLLAEQAFQQTGCTSQDCAVKLGQMLNVQRMIVGSCGKLLGKYIVNLRVIDVETGKATCADEASGVSVDQIRQGLKDLSARMVSRRI